MDDDGWTSLARWVIAVSNGAGVQKMITIGLRVAPKVVTFAIYDTDTSEVLNVEEINVPSAFEFPDALKYVRSNILDVLREYGVKQGGLRTTEPVAQAQSIERVQIEGVIQEAFASSTLVKYFTGPIAIVATKIGVARTAIKPMVAGQNDLNIEGWDDMTPAKREALLCALGAANA